VLHERPHAIFQTHPWFARPFKIRDFLIELSMASSHGAHVSALSRRSATPDPEDRRDNGAGWPPAVHLGCKTIGLERWAEEYRKQLSAVGLTISSEYEDEGQNHYFDAFKKRIA
jgi:hypothetical protein